MNKLFLFVSFLLLFTFFACDKDDSIDTSDVSVDVKLPESLSERKPELKSATLELTNVNTGIKTTETITTLSSINVNVEDGLYNLLITGDIAYSTTDADSSIVQQEGKVRAAKDNVEIVGGKIDLSIELFFYKESTGFVISEIFFSGTKTPEGKQYQAGDKYIELFNNSSDTLYADGLCIAESELNTAQALNKYTPDIRPTETPVSAVYRIPGNGKDYPVLPGETILLCDVAINHTSDNSNSFDLSKANFEWFDGADKDVDVPEVPNMIKMVSSLASGWSLHNRGFTSYILFRMDDVSPENFTENYAYHYQYTFVWGDFIKIMEFDKWKVPNDKIIDAVECSAPSSYEWKALDPSLDLTWTHSGDGNDERYGKSVKRKVSHKESDGRKVLMDTNDSAFDFIPTAEPSPGTIE